MKHIYRILSILFILNGGNISAQVIVDSIDITVTFYGPFNKTTVKFYLCNHSELDSIEGNFEFATNKTSFIEDMYLDINGELKKAQTLSQSQGTRIYDLITNKRIDPALLLKIGEGKYSLKVFPFLKYQTRLVVVDFYSVVESDTIGLPEWHFNISTPHDIKSKISFSSIQESNVNVYRVNKNHSELIPSVKTIDQMSRIEQQTNVNSMVHRYQFDFRDVKRTPLYYSDSINFYQTNSCRDSLSVKLNLFISPVENYTPDFLTKLLTRIKSGENFNVLASGKDNFLNNFLQYLQMQEKISLSLNKDNPHNLSEYVDDSYNWTKLENKWAYSDKNFVLSPKQPDRNLKFIKFECPYLKKFIEYTKSLESNVESQPNFGFLNSNLSKLVIEDDKRAIQIWESVTKTKYDAEPTYFMAVEEMPEPIGGITAIQNSIYFPPSLKNIGNFKVYILAHINKTGHVNKMEVIRQPDFNRDLNSLIEKVSRFGICFPNWKPGKQRGKPVLVMVSIPLVFKTDSTSTDTLIKLEEYNFGARRFISVTSDRNKCYLSEDNFIEDSSEVVEYNSSHFYELLIQYPEMIEVIYKTIHLSFWDGVGFIDNSSEKIKHYFIKKS